MLLPKAFFKPVAETETDWFRRLPSPRAGKGAWSRRYMSGGPVPALPSPRVRISDAPGCPFPRPSGASTAVARHTLHACIAVCRGVDPLPLHSHQTATPQTIPALPVLPSQRKVLGWLNCNAYRYMSTLLRCAQRDRELMDAVSGKAALVPTPLGPASYLAFTWSGISLKRALFMEQKSSSRTPTRPRRPSNPPG